MNKHKENPFKQLEAEEQLPENLKEKVMTSVGIAEMLSGFTELFTVNLAGTAAKMVAPGEEDPKTGKKKGEIETGKHKGKSDPEAPSSS